MSVQQDVETRPELQRSDPGDHDRFTHYVDRRRWNLTEAAIEGYVVQAECGKLFLPILDPQKYPICQTCQAIVDARSVD